MASAKAPPWEIVQEILADLLELPAAERPAALLARCGADGPLRRELESLLEAAERPDCILDAPVAAGGLGACLPVLEAGRHLGPYRLVRVLGQGGMGVVHLAERDDGAFQLRVAIKQLWWGVGRPELRERFQQERQILARLQHPSIARLLDGGEAHGAPWLAMEYVDGEPIDSWCRRHALGLDARLTLFLKVCDAVDYAHRRLIVHRDLKPSNVLVTADGEVKLLDFGIAKLLPRPGEGARPATLEGALTPAYASPEQIRGEPISTASDVYALGVLLYELLCGQHPHELGGLTPAQIERRVCEEAPEPPSRRVSCNQGDVGPIPARRLRGDVDTIVLKALSPEPERRYAGADELAEDLRRHRQHRPVRARPEGLVYRLGKLIRRRLAWVGVGVLFAAALLTFAAVVTAQKRAAREERDRAREIASVLKEMLTYADPDISHRRVLTARELVDHGARRVRAELGDRPEVQAELQGVLARVYLSMAAFAEAEEMASRAVDTLDAPGRPPTAAAAQAWIDLSHVYREQGRWDDARDAARRAMALLDASEGEGDVNLVSGLEALAAVERASGQLRAALPLRRQVVELLVASPTATPAELAQAQSDLGVIYDQLGQAKEAERWYREALASWSVPEGVERPEQAKALNNLGLSLLQQGRLDEALKAHGRALDLRRRLLGEAHPAVTRSLVNLSITYAAKGDMAKARAMAQQAADLRAAIYGPHHPLTLGARSALLSQALQVEAPDVVEAAQALLSARRAARGDSHPETAMSWAHLGLAHLQAAQLAPAETAFTTAARLFEQNRSAELPERAFPQLGLAELRLMQARPADALPLLIAAEAHLSQQTINFFYWLARARLALARCYQALGQPAEAAAAQARAAQYIDAWLAPEHPLSRALAAQR